MIEVVLLVLAVVVGVGLAMRLDLEPHDVVAGSPGTEPVGEPVVDLSRRASPTELRRAP